MPAPSDPVRGYSFTDFATSNPTTPPPGNQLDTEFDRSNAAIAAVIDFVRTSLADDGTLKPGTVGAPQLTSGILDDLGQDAAEDAAASALEAAASKGLAEAAAVQAGASATASQGYATSAAGSVVTAAAHVANALTYRNEALAFRDTASTHATNAGNFANDALLSRNAASNHEVLSRRWAEDLSGPVDDGYYSARFYALQAIAANSGNTAGTAAGVLFSSYETLVGPNVQLAIEQLKDYADTMVLRAGDTMTGALTINTTGEATPTPPTAAHFHGVAQGVANVVMDGFGSPGAFSGRRANGTPNAPTGLILDNAIATVRAYGHDGTAFVTPEAGNFRFVASETWSPTARGTKWDLRLTPSGTTTLTTVLSVASNGDLTPGADNTQQLGTSALKWSQVNAVAGVFTGTVQAGLGGYHQLVGTGTDTTLRMHVSGGATGWATGLNRPGDSAGTTLTWSSYASATWTARMHLSAAGLRVGAGTTIGAVFDGGAHNTSQTSAVFSARGVPNALEWGHGNAAGYANTFGYQSSSGRPYIVFNGEAGSTVINTIRTRGVKARGLIGDNAGGVSFFTVANANADDQAIITDLTLSSIGYLGFGAATSPTSPIQIGTSASPLTPGGGYLVQSFGGGNSYWLLSAATNFNSAVHFGDPASNTVGRIEYVHNGDRMEFHTAGAERMRINANGNMLVGTTADGGARLGIACAAAGTAVQCTDNTYGTFVIRFNAGTGVEFGSLGGSPMNFLESNTVRLQIATTVITASLPVVLPSGASRTAAVRTGTSTEAISTKTAYDAAAYVALADAATIAWDLGLGINFSVTLAGNRTLGAPTNTVPGKTGSILVYQDGTGGRTLAYNAVFKFANGVAPTLDTVASRLTMLFYQVIDSSNIFISHAPGVR